MNTFGRCTRLGKVYGFFLIALSACGGGSNGGSAPAGCVSTPTIVCTQSGQLQGAVEGGYRVFRGIPFAEPPVGDLRWRPPAALASWQGVRDATKFGNKCPQIDQSGTLVGDEDCLTLNIFAVNPPASSKQPVMVYFHAAGKARAAPKIRRGMLSRWRGTV